MMLTRRFQGKDAKLPIAIKRFAAITFVCLTGIDNVLYAQDCEAIHDVVEYDAALGLLPNQSTPP